ncbi:MAG: diphthine synthase [Candidatus Aenigmatarchaeota archaeon]
MLTLVGLGLSDEKDISLRGVEAIEKADKVFLESYTSPWKGLEGLRDLVEKNVESVERSDLEENADRVLKPAEEEDVAVLIPGDPLVATTHVELLLQAERKNVETEVVHSSSIYSAVAETGLQIYKFGKTTTIPIPQKNYRPRSPYEAIEENKERGLHTLALLDIKDRPMEVGEGLEYLLKLEEEKQNGIINKDMKVVALSVGPEDKSMAYEEVSKLLKRDFPTPAVIIFPGKLHEKEEEALEVLAD